MTQRLTRGSTEAQLAGAAGKVRNAISGRDSAKAASGHQRALRVGDGLQAGWKSQTGCLRVLNEPGPAPKECVLVALWSKIFTGSPTGATECLTGWKGGRQSSTCRNGKWTGNTGAGSMDPLPEGGSSPDNSGSFSLGAALGPFKTLE
jgi:hypothetical protein